MDDAVQDDGADDAAAAGVTAEAGCCSSCCFEVLPRYAFQAAGRAVGERAHQPRTTHGKESKNPS